MATIGSLFASHAMPSPVTGWLEELSGMKLWDQLELEPPPVSVIAHLVVL